MKVGNRLICDCCARQIISGYGSPDKHVTYGPVTLLDIDTHACANCTQDPLLRHQYALEE
jgi:hypothetical protein